MRLTKPCSLFLCLFANLAQGQSDTILTPEQFFGFKIGSDGELARYPKVLEYLQHLSARSGRMTYEELGKTTMGNTYALSVFSSPENLARLDRLIEINRLLADPRKLSQDQVEALVEEGRPFYFLYATIHSTEVGNGQAIIEIAHELATTESRKMREILDNAVVLMVPSQNPDGQLLVIDHYYKYRGTRYSSGFPGLYHKYTGHDDNRDWFMFTQIETRLNVEKVQNVYRPQVTHDMHQMGSNGFRMFVPPFIDPYDPNIHPILSQGQARIGMAMASELVAAGKQGVGFFDRYDLWTPARQYMVYHGQPRILTEIASAHLAMPLIDPEGKPLGPQDRRWNFPLPYAGSQWHLRDIVDYGKIAVFAGLSHVAKYRHDWLENFYKVHRDWVQRSEPPYAFVLPATQRDPFETLELLQILEIGDVEIHRADAPFVADGREYAAGSWVIKLAQPYGAFAKTMLEHQEYPNLRYFPGGPPIPPYDATGHSLGPLMGVDVQMIEAPFSASLSSIDKVTAAETPSLSANAAVYAFGPESNAGFIAAARLQAANIPLLRASTHFAISDDDFAPGTWLLPANAEARGILTEISQETGLIVDSLDSAPKVAGHLLKQNTRIGLWKGAGNMPGGWMKWLFERYGFNHRTISSLDFKGALSDRYDVIVWPAGTDKRRILRGLDRRFHDESWAWAYGVGQRGWDQLREWVEQGGTLVALGNSVETAREMFDLPIAKVLPQRAGRGRRRAQPTEATADLRQTFQSPANLIAALTSKVVDQSSLFYCPGSLLSNEFDPTHPVAYGMPETGSVFFRNDQAYRLTPGFSTKASVLARYPAQGPILVSGWLLGEEYLHDQANAIAFEIGRGRVVTLASQVAFRTQARGTFKLLFNPMFNGPAQDVTAVELQRILANGN